MDTHNHLYKRIKSKKAKVGLIGVGYVGSALGIGAAVKGFQVMGYGRSRQSKRHVKSLKVENFKATNYIEDLEDCDIICICVPTPVFPDKSPDTRPLIDALKKTLLILRKGMLVVVESSIAPGMTRNIAVPILNTSGLKLEKDYFLSFSPERIDPGNKKYDFTKIPKVVSGYGVDSLRLASAFYNEIVVSVHPVSSFEVAEMSKILENTFRLVNISMINQLTQYTESIGIDMWEVMDAAGTKPFGFMPHYPGPGIGGHCIPVDPHYLLEDARGKGIVLSIVEEAGRINDLQPKRVVDQIKDILNRFSNGVRRDRVLMIGVSYKENISDTRETPAEKILEYLEEDGIKVSYHDPYVPKFGNLTSLPLSKKTLSQHDMVVIITPHQIINFDILLDHKIPILDTKNVLSKNGGKINLPHSPNQTIPQVFKMFNQASMYRK